MSTDNESFFGKRFWQQMLIHWSGSIFTLIIAGVATIYIGNQIERLTELSKSVSESVQGILALVEVGPEGIAEVGQALQENAGEAGAAIGDGAATVVDRVGSAWDRFKAPAADGEPTE